MDYGALAGSMIQLAGGLAGSAQQQEGAAAQNKLLEDAYRRALALLESGELSAEKLGPSAGANVRPDQLSQLAQRDALLQLQEQARNGFGAVDKAALNNAMTQAGSQERMNREAILSRLQPGSGQSIAARLSAQQSAANRGGQQALDIAAMAQKNRAGALAQLGDMSSRMRGQSFGEAKQRADSMDAISRFNAETSRFNVGSKLSALGLAAGAGGKYGEGLANMGNLKANQTAGVGQGIAGGINAISEGTSGNGVKYDASGNPYYSDPYEWNNPYGGY